MFTSHARLNDEVKVSILSAGATRLDEFKILAGLIQITAWNDHRPTIARD
jgi:hypothetical protein